MEGLPYTCYRRGHRGRYVKRHNAFLYFRSVATDGSCRRVVPGKRLHADLSRDRLAALNWIIPNQCNNTHDCEIQVGDHYLRRLVPRLLRHVGPDGFCRHHLG
jgi:acid phosphatase